MFSPLSEDYNQTFFELYKKKLGAFQKLKTRIVFIVPIPKSEINAFKKKHGIKETFLIDDNRALCRAFGISEKITTTPHSYFINRNQKIISIQNNRNAENHMGDLLREADRIFSSSTENNIELPVNAPVIIIPDALSPSQCQMVIDYWKNGRKYEGTIGTEINKEGKRRQDVDGVDYGFLSQIDIALTKRLFPEIHKVFGLDISCRDRYKIGRYDSKEKGFYNQHRDTGIPSLSHRRISMSLLLSDNFDGGWLELPEYGPEARFKVKAGQAICFPSTVLHSVTPVTKGERFVMVSFFHGKIEEEWRRKHLEDNGQEYDPDNVRLFCEKTYPELQYSKDFYTRAG